VDENLRTNVPSIYAIGDVTGGWLLAHKAQREGIVVAESLAGKETKIDYRVVPWAIFSSPEIAVVGVTEDQARERGMEVIVGEMPFMATEKANIIQESEGMVRILAEKETKKILGAQIIGPNASIMIGELSVAVQKGLTLEDVANTIHPHPSLVETVMEACKDGLGKAFFLRKK